jgi:hypothetical protein
LVFCGWGSVVWLRNLKDVEVWERGGSKNMTMTLTDAIHVPLNLENEIPYFGAAIWVLETQRVVYTVGFRPYY